MWCANSCIAPNGHSQSQNKSRAHSTKPRIDTAQIANETGAVIGGKLYSDALSSEDQPASTYLDMMRHNTKTLSQALGD